MLAAVLNDDVSRVVIQDEIVFLEQRRKEIELALGTRWMAVCRARRVAAGASGTGTVRMRPVLALEVNQHPAAIPLLDVLHRKRGGFGAAQPAPNEQRPDDAIAAAVER
jgi:hypothetical protein